MERYYTVRPNGSVYEVICKVVYDSGHSKIEVVDSFEGDTAEAEAEAFAEELNAKED